MTTPTLVDDGSRVFSRDYASSQGPLFGDAQWNALRERALLSFEGMGLPTRKLENWKYSDSRFLAKTPWQAPHPKAMEGVLEEDLERFFYGEISGARLVFIDGHYCDRLSRIGDLQDGISVAPLSEVHDDELRELIDSQVASSIEAGKAHSNAFALLNAAQCEDGAVIRVSPKTEVDGFINLLFLTTITEGPTLAQPRNFIILGERSQVHVVERHIGLAEDTQPSEYFNNVVTQVRLGPEAILNYDRVQREDAGAIHLGSIEVHQDRGSQFKASSVAFGASFGRIEFAIEQRGAGAETDVSGLYFGRNRQHHDNQIIVKHMASQGRSKQLFKGILDGHSQGIFNGRIVVPENIVGTEAEQTNANLLLSADASVNTKPQLEIYAEDVKCSHGATIGALDADQLFFLRSRGMTKKSAQSLLTAAFASDVIDAIQFAPMRERWRERLGKTLTGGSPSADQEIKG
ncbi:MAG: Fe-S cluster assembly protein SufD [Planctomycetota bacterium]